MAKILLTWELGLNSGHAVRLAQLAQALQAAGHETCFAVQRPDSLRRWRGQAGFTEVRQAPIWPGLLRHNDVPPLRGERSWGDLLTAMGMHDSGVLEYMLRCWDAILTDSGADMVIADFAPAAMLAARGRVPVVAVGTGFTVPPSEGATFPLLRGDKPLIAEDALLTLVNRALSRVGRPALSHLPEMAVADLACPATFAELDPYRGRRTGAVYPPFVSGETGQAGEGQAVFAYFTVADARTAALMRALPLVAKAGALVRAWLPGIQSADAKDLTAAGVEVLTAPAPQPEIAATSRLLITTGGLGMASFALAAGLPMAILPVDLEKALTADAIAALGSGTVLPQGQESAALAQSIQAAANATELRTRARFQYPDFKRRCIPPAEIIAQQCLSLL